jgi:aspartyl-tRNA(Asn)/glutamyl-tRNA(Gln) amidotransferase subunit A
MTEPIDLTALQMVAAYASGELSPVDVTVAALSVIAERDGDINAFCLVDEEAALAQARKSEARWQGSYTKGLFDGVPVAIKDVFRTQGWPTLRGSRIISAAGPWHEDSPAVGKIRSDGMVILGKTTTPELAWKGVTDSPLSGITRNPVDFTRTAGGSSGGSAAAVAAGMAPLSIGTDGGGSIRVPASFCGVVGFKPTHGRVPMYPISPLGPLVHAGPITRTVEETALLMDIIALPDHRDPTSLPPTLATYRGEIHRDVVGLDVAYSPTLGYVSVDPEIDAAVAAAVRALAEAGLNVVEANPGFADPIDAFEIMWATGVAAMLRGYDEQARGLVDPGLVAMWDRGLSVSGADYVDARQVCIDLGQTLGQFHEAHSLLITPTIPIPAFDAGHDVPVGSGMRWWAQWTPFTYPFNMTHQPALSIPIGKTVGGLPIGMQIVGPRHSDDLVLAVGRFAEQVLT